MEQQFLSTENLDRLYDSVQSTILTEKNIDIDNNSQFKSLIPKLAIQVYDKKQGLSLEELNEVCLKTVTIFFTNIINKKIKKREEDTESFEDYSESTYSNDGKKEDDDFFEKLKEAVDKSESENGKMLLEPFQNMTENSDNNSSYNPNNTPPIYKFKQDPFIVVLDVHPSNNDPNSNLTINDEFKEIKCTLSETIKLTKKCNIYLEFLVLNELKQAEHVGSGSLDSNIEAFHTFVLKINELKGQQTISNNTFFNGSIVIPNDTYGYNENATGEIVGIHGDPANVTPTGGGDGNPSDANGYKKYTSHTIKLKSNFICTEGKGTFTTFTVSISGLLASPNGISVPLTLAAASSNSRLQVGLLFKPIND
jgi:hypothetical protein